MSRYTDTMEEALGLKKPQRKPFTLRGLVKKLTGTTAQAVNGIIPIEDREPYCWGCSQGYPTFKIGSYVYHSIGPGGASGCSIADKALRKDKG